MARKSARDASRSLRVGIAAASWVASVVVMQAVAGADIARGARQLEQRIELQLKQKGGWYVPAGDSEPPRRTHEDAIEPWELVGV